MTNSSRKSKRAAPLSLRLNDAERAILIANAGNLPLSTYIKSVLFADGVERRRKAPKVIDGDRAELARLLAWLGQTQIATHLAILAQAAETGNLFVDEPVISQLMKACADIDAMREALMRAMGKVDTSDDDQSSDVIILPAFMNAAKPSEA